MGHLSQKCESVKKMQKFYFFKLESNDKKAVKKDDFFIWLKLTVIF